MENADLDPCPFCGGDAEFVRKGSGRRSCIVACTECGCRLEANEAEWCSGVAWNTRHTYSCTFRPKTETPG